MYGRITKMYESSKKIVQRAGLVGGLAIGGIGVLALVVGPSHLDRDGYRVSVVGTQTKRDPSGNKDKYLVMAKVLAEDGVALENHEEKVFENTDSSVEFKWNSSTLQAKLQAAEKEGKTCVVKTYGWRFPFRSWYENIVEVECE